jgi:hypothetical protein
MFTIPEAVGGCPAYKPPPNAILTANATGIGSFVKVKCALGYHKSGGDEKLACLPSLSWAGKAIVCKGKKYMLCTGFRQCIYSTVVTSIIRPQFSTGRMENDLANAG